MKNDERERERERERESRRVLIRETFSTESIKSRVKFH